MQGLLIAIARILTGFVFLVIGFSKVFLPATVMGKSFVEFFPSFVQQTLTSGHPYPFWRPMLEHIVAPHPTLFAYAVGIGEFVLGLSLLLGFFTRLSSFFGIALMFSIHFNENPFASAEPFASQLGKLLPHLSLILLFLMFVATNAGATLGLDSGKKKKKPSEEKEK